MKTLGEYISFLKPFFVSIQLDQQMVWDVFKQAMRQAPHLVKYFAFVSSAKSCNLII